MRGVDSKNAAAAWAAAPFLKRERKRHRAGFESFYNAFLLRRSCPWSRMEKWQNKRVLRTFSEKTLTPWGEI